MSEPPTPPPAPATRRRRLRAVLAADVVNFTGLVSINETIALDSLLVAHKIAREELAEHGGWLFGLPGDGIFALFESAVDAVRCGLDIQDRLDATGSRQLRFRIGVHLGEVLFQDEAPFGETLVIAARLEALAEPGKILVSEAVREAVAPRIVANFSEAGFFNLKNSPRRIETFLVTSVEARGGALDATASGLDRTVLARPQPEVDELRVEPRPAMRLPQAAPLVVRPVEPAPDADAQPTTETPSPVPSAQAPYTLAFLDEVTLLLTTHLGPVARVLVRKHAAAETDVAALIERLARQIPTATERIEFSEHAAAAVRRKL